LLCRSTLLFVARVPVTRRFNVHPSFVRAVRARLLTKARRRQAKAFAKDAREVRRVAVADEPRDVAHRDRRLLGEQLRRG
jgi:hypothetical protein